MTALPDYLPPIGEFPDTNNFERIEDKAPIYLHNWIYSVVPISTRTEEWVAQPEGGNRPQIDYPLFAYLVGYCRACNRAFSEQVPTGWTYIETQMSISKEGCVAPR